MNKDYTKVMTAMSPCLSDWRAKLSPSEVSQGELLLTIQRLHDLCEKPIAEDAGLELWRLYAETGSALIAAVKLATDKVIC